MSQNKEYYPNTLSEDYNILRTCLRSNKRVLEEIYDILKEDEKDTTITIAEFQKLVNARIEELEKKLDVIKLVTPRFKFNKD